MGDPLLTTLVGVGAALTKMFFRAYDRASAADLIGDGQELLGTLLRLLRRSDGSKDQIERSVSKALAARVQEIHKHRCGQDIDRQLLSGVCTEVEILLNEIANDGELVLSAALNSDNFSAVFHSHASQRRLNVEEAAEPYFDELVEAVAAQYAALAPWSRQFQIEALRSVLAGIDELQANSRRSLDAHAVTHDKLDTLSSRLEEVARHENNPSRVIFGSRPDVVTGDRCIERDEQKHLNALIIDPTKRRTVLVGMRGCGKTQLASALAQQCEDANWNLVAWVDAGSPESIKSGLVELAKELKIDTSDQPTQEQIVGRCLNYLRSSGGSDRLVVFDNVEDINDLRGFVPTGEGLRVVATTTNDKGWNYQGWDPIRIGVFDRETSIDYLLTVTNSADREAAYTLAERLGDLPLAITQAAATARHKDLSLARYLKRLESRGEELVIRPIPGDEYTDDVATVLWMAVEAAIDSMKNGAKQMARRQLGALALLAESGVPTRWLDPTSAQGGDEDSQGAEHSTDDEAHDALTELISRSIVQQTAHNRSKTTIHRLQAQVLRNSWNNCELDDARAAATGLLGSVNISRYPSNDTKARRQEALDLVDQLRSIGTQEHSQVLFESPHTPEALFQAFSHASDLGLPYEALTLDVAVDALEGLLGPDHPVTLALRNNLAGAYESAGRLTEAITLYEQVTKDCARVLGEDDPVTLALLNNLAGAYESAGRLTEAITLYEQVLPDRIRGLGEDHHDTLTSRNNLAGAYESAGRLTEAITLYEQVTKDCARILGKDHPDTLTSRNNLAGAYESAGRLTEAITLFEQVLPDRIRVLGEDHPHALASRNNLAVAYESAGRLTAAITLFEQVLPDSIRVLGEDHPDTLASCNNLAGAYKSAGRLTEAITLYEQVLPDRIRVLGEDHPRTLISRNNLAGAYESAGRLTEAITLYEQVTKDCARILGKDHPDTLTSRNNLAGAYKSAGRLTEAITLYEQVLPDRIRVLGEDHPDTLTSRNNLAAAYKSAGRLTEAITLYEQVTKDCARILGEDHPLTKTVRENREASRRELAQREDSSPTEESAQED